MRKIFLAITLLCLAIGPFLTLQRCANPLPPEGGDRDTIGPVVLGEESTPPFQKNFRPDRIELTFDEWVKIKDPTQIIISPPIEPPPKASLKKRTLILDFSEVALRDSATYVINIGEAVVDLNEGNAPDNLRFVFATGSVLDSASVKGQLVDAYTNEPVKEALFALYANLTDTIVKAENPFYFAKADEDGNFEISNIRPGTYQAIALDNGGFGGYQLGRSTKQVGLLDTFLVIPDSNLTLPDVKLSPLPTRLRLLEKDTSEFGEVKITFDRPATEVNLRSDIDYIRVNDGDTLRLFFTVPRSDDLLFGVDTTFLDTFQLRLMPPGVPSQPLRITKRPDRGFNPRIPFSIVFNRPLTDLDTSLVRMLADTLPQRLPFTYRVDTSQANRLVFQYSWKEATAYKMTFLPGAVRDIYNLQNTDTLQVDVKVVEQKSLGTLNLTVLGLDSTVSYVMRLVKGSNPDLVESFLVVQKDQFETVLAGLPPAEYKLEIITDRNSNGRYDGADWDKQRLPEEVQVFPLEALRANWEVEAKVDLKSSNWWLSSLVDRSSGFMVAWALLVASWLYNNIAVHSKLYTCEVQSSNI